MSFLFVLVWTTYEITFIRFLKLLANHNSFYKHLWKKTNKVKYFNYYCLYVYTFCQNYVLSK